ncbi:MAG TPA: AAA family ATPase, partial [Thermoanaerobaculia bacterium]|nr:AAA family ATPase [Thermoanaerobaculia bacterium]
MNYLPRHAATILQQSLDVSPVVAVMGARQTGKSTLVRNEAALANHLYLTLDDLDVAERARLAPEDLVRSAPRLILDEVQRAPHLIHAIKRVVDETSPRQPGQFVLTGSANLLLMQRVSETLAGRATYLTVWPLTRSERLGLGGTGIWDDLFDQPVAQWLDLFLSSDLGTERQRSGDGSPNGSVWREQARIGGYPVPALELADDAQRTIWFDGYVRTYLERDLQDLAAIDNLVDFRR